MKRIFKICLIAMMLVSAGFVQAQTLKFALV